jgi:hypothetical protein
MRRQVGWFTDGKPGYLVPFQQIRIRFGLAQRLFLSPFLFYSHMTIQTLDSKHVFPWMEHCTSWVHLLLVAESIAITARSKLQFTARVQAETNSLERSQVKSRHSQSISSQVPTLSIKKFELDLIWWELVTV